MDPLKKNSNSTQTESTKETTREKKTSGGRTYSKMSSFIGGISSFGKGLYNTAKTIVNVKSEVPESKSTDVSSIFLRERSNRIGKGHPLQEIWKREVFQGKGVEKQVEITTEKKVLVESNSEEKLENGAVLLEKVLAKQEKLKKIIENLGLNEEESKNLLSSIGFDKEKILKLDMEKNDPDFVKNNKKGIEFKISRIDNKIEIILATGIDKKMLSNLQINSAMGVRELIERHDILMRKKSLTEESVRMDQGFAVTELDKKSISELFMESTSQNKGMTTALKDVQQDLEKLKSAINGLKKEFAEGAQSVDSDTLAEFNKMMEKASVKKEKLQGMCNQIVRSSNRIQDDINKLNKKIKSEQDSSKSDIDTNKLVQLEKKMDKYVRDIQELQVQISTVHNQLTGQGRKIQR